MRTSIAAALALVLAAGCTDQPTAPTALGDPAPAPSFDIGNPGYLNGPEYPGNSGVWRFDTDDGHVFHVFTNDPARDLITTWFDAPNWAFLGCGSSFLEPSSGQYITDPAGITRAMSTLQGVHVFVYRLSTFSTSNDCEYFANDWLYQGHISSIDVDNDFFGVGPGGNAFGWTAQGTVCDQAGDPYKYHEQQKALILPDGTFAGFLTENIKITGPLPAGANGC
jgi:hypothetical protein